MSWTGVLNKLTANIVCLIAIISFIYYFNDVKKGDQIKILILVAIFLLLNTKYEYPPYD